MMVVVVICFHLGASDEREREIPPRTSITRRANQGELSRGAPRISLSLSLAIFSLTVNMDHWVYYSV